ncbi:MAG: transglycosylase SLT domain-containing protein [Candidatus Dormibacteria bacterium]
METAAKALGALGEYQVTLPLHETVVTPPPPPPPPPPVKAPMVDPVIQARPEVVAPSVAAIEQIILSASKRYGVPYGRLLSVAKCESSLNPLAVNRSSGASGLFQFMPATFYGHGGTDIWNPTQQANTAAKMFSIGESSEWVCK